MTTAETSPPETTTDDGYIYCNADVVRTQIVSILRAWGMPNDSADVTADVMVDTDLSGIDSHGMSMLMMYESLHRRGRLDLSARSTASQQGDSFVVLNAHNGLGHPVAVDAMEQAISLARRRGIGMAAVHNSHHFGAAGYYVRSAAQRGMIAMVTSSTRTPVVAATGAHQPVLGTNPIAFGAPRTDAEPIVVDMSTSVVAMNKVKAYGLQGRQLPAGWVTDLDGLVLTDAKLAFDKLLSGEAVLSPLGGPGTSGGGHKGFGLSLMVQILSSALSNAASPGHDGDHDNIGHFFMAIDPQLINPAGGTTAHIDALAASVLDDDRVMMPGEPEALSRTTRTAEGIPVPTTLRDHVRAICERAGVDFLLEATHHTHRGLA